MKSWLVSLGGPMIAGLCTWGPTPACASEPAEAAPSAEAPPTPVDEAVESARRSVRSTAEWLARGVDSWFADKPFSEDAKVTDGQLGLRFVARQHAKPDYSVRFNARFRLPNLEKKAYLFVGRDDQRELVTDKPDAFSREQRLLRENTADRSFFAGLGVRPHEHLEFRLGFHGGLKPYAQARYRQAWQFGSADLVDFRESLFVSRDDRLGSTTAVSYEHAFSSTFAARWLNSATITQRSRRFEWSSSLGAYKSLGDQRLLSIEALSSGAQRSGVDVSDYGVQVRWEQPVYKDWLLGEVLLGHFWPRNDPASERGRAWAVGGGVRMKF